MGPPIFGGIPPGRAGGGNDKLLYTGGGPELGEVMVMGGGGMKELLLLVKWEGTPGPPACGLLSVGEIRGPPVRNGEGGGPLEFG